ncbi:MAG: YoaM [Candidatus Amesbacteria bacterium GW2011_GWB1_47_19]|nr:MAG: YoaM [Candidatus Amesbacteria bacterium GW2011_GWA1_44_24]KKU31346.1 MAG: YoaM [Candidatus Amesbacteria bacterium GW2011_GWC1_46_24]KKU67001.1 MAG: YoaM [Candidatus Amesbacteria bacterium GW2011_GWB1_47_19]OGD04837.1 MAG: hypothetical protein A2379_04705 [Candidatus Amesbacteria bacterium RIFOXYB1_FULL_47_13]HBC72779.1 hypothetical protein [Candidatus Amesbacteria bacterium]
MCGRYSFIPPADFFSRLEITNRDYQLQANYHVTPGSFMPVVFKSSPKQVANMRWGLIPYWAKDPRIAYHTINARVEGLASKPAFRGLLKNRRCLIPASGFFEWARTGNTKKPYFVKLKNHDWFVFAGLYDIWKDPEGMEHKTYTIITVPANSVVAKIHDRMPAILKARDEDLWADNSSYSPNLLRLLVPYPAGDMSLVPASLGEKLV